MWDGKPARWGALLVALSVSGFDVLPAQGRTDPPTKRDPAALVEKGHAQFKEARFEDAVGSFGQALKIYEEASNTAGMADSLFWLGRTHSRLNEYREAVEHLRRAERLHKRLQDTAALAKDLSFLGDVLRDCS